MEPREPDYPVALWVMGPSASVCRSWVASHGLLRTRLLTDAHQLEGQVRPHFVLLPGWDDLPYSRVRKILNRLFELQAIEHDYTHLVGLLPWTVGPERPD